MSSAPRSGPSLIADPCYLQLKSYIIESTGLSYYASKDDELSNHVSRRLTASKCADSADYLNLLHSGKAGEAELDALITDLTIGETFFFRHREQFDALRDVVLPEIVKRNQPQRRIRIWSAGCATGAEPYSLSILLRRDLAHLLAGWDVTILGTDINRDFLAHAQKGEFGEWAFRSAPPEFKQACFTRAGSMWLLAPEFREGVSFQYHNLVQHHFPSMVNNLFAFDLILCRNVMIYFDQAIIRKLLSQFHDSIVDEGWLLVGHAEPNVDFFRAFRTVNVPGAVLYQKSAQPAVPRDWLTSPPIISEPYFPERFPAAPFPAMNDWPVFPARPEPVVRNEPKPAPPIERQRAVAPPGKISLAEVRAKADRGQWEEAARDCRELMDKERLNPSVHFYHALVSEQMGQHADTEQSLRRTIYLDRAFVLAHYYLGLVLQRKGDAPGAQRSFRNATQLLQDMPEDKVFEDADGITAGELKKLASMNLEVLKER